MEDTTQLTEEQIKEQQDEQALLEMASKFNVDTVYKLQVPTDSTYENFAVAYLKYPSLNSYSIALTLEDTNPLKGKLIVLKDMFLEGDKRIITPDDSAENMKLFLCACTKIDAILDVKASLLKKKSKNTL